MGGRIERSPMSFDTRHPIILAKNSYVVGLLIRQSHENVKHFGVNSVLCHLRQRYWPIRGREQVKKILGMEAVYCARSGEVIRVFNIWLTFRHLELISQTLQLHLRVSIILVPSQRRVATEEVDEGRDMG